MKLSFKKEKKETGLAGIGRPYPNTLIKADKKEVGCISAPNWRTKDDLWRVSFAKKTENSFKWVYLKKKFESEIEARVWIKENWTLIQKQIDLYQFED